MTGATCVRASGFTDSLHLLGHFIDTLLVAVVTVFSGGQHSPDICLIHTTLCPACTPCPSALAFPARCPRTASPWVSWANASILMISGPALRAS